MSQIQYQEIKYDESSRLKRESLFHLASGKLGVRGAFEEGAPEGALSIRGTYLNGFCENEPIRYNERLSGFADMKQQIVSLPDAQTIRIFADGELLTCWGGDDLIQTLDMENGVYDRTFRCSTGKGDISVRFTRLVSFVKPEIFAVECTVTSLGFEGGLSVESCLNPDVRNFTAADDPRVASGDGKMLTTVYSGYSGKAMTVISSTINSRRMVACASVHDIPGMESAAPGENGLLTMSAALSLPKYGTVRFRKYSIYREISGKSELDAVVSELLAVRDEGFGALQDAQRSFLRDFWSNSRVQVEGDDYLQAQLDFCLYGMLASAGRDGKTSTAAKGLSGEGYEGHYFWDSEIYIFPFFLMTEPKTAKALLEYRYRHLDAARAHAAEMGHGTGALYPWRTISGGECSSHYPSGSAQYHINGDIAHAFVSYWNVTHDEEFLDKTCEVLAETSRLWLDTGHWYDGSFRIDCVTGPDEYTCVVNNNYYTNCCAAANLIGTADLCGELEKLGRLDALKEKIGLTDAEISEFRRAGEGMYFPFDPNLKIIAQDDSFLSKKRVNIADIPKENFPLLMHYHPLIINRYQILKQADAVLANLIYRENDVLTMKRSYEYYESITTHDSSLSHCIYAIMAARLGDLESAYSHFIQCVGTDTGDQNGNTKDGLHIANMGGVYRVMTEGFGGIKVSDNDLSIFPLLPSSLKSIRFPLFYHGRRILVTAEKDKCILHLTQGEPIELTVFGKKVLLSDELTAARKVRGVVFDLDGVITDTAVFHFQAWKQLADRLGIPFDAERNEAFKGVSRAQCLRLLLGWGSMTVSDEEFAAMLKEKNDIYCGLLDSLTPDSILPGIKECLSMLKENGIPAALFSVSKNTDRILGQLGIRDSFDAIVTGNDIEHSKPHFEGFLLAAERIGTDPRLCVMVEDSEAGIRGAQNVAMKTLAIMKNNVADADICIPDTSGIAEAVRSMI